MPPAPRFVLVALANRADETGFCYPSIRWVQRKTGFADSNIRKYIGDLEGMGKLRKTNCKRQDGGKAASEYQLLLEQPGLQLAAPPPPAAGDTPPAAGGGTASSRRYPPPAAGDLYTKTNHTKVETKKQGALVSERPDWLPPQWEEFLADRKERGKKMTSRAQLMAIERLALYRAAGHDLAAILAQSIERGWSSLHPVKVDTHPSRGGSAASIAETNRRTLEEFVRRHGEST